jgi:hypothetical protein
MITLVAFEINLAIIKSTENVNKDSCLYSAEKCARSGYDVSVFNGEIESR